MLHTFLIHLFGVEFTEDENTAKCAWHCKCLANRGNTPFAKNHSEPHRNRIVKFSAFVFLLTSAMFVSACAKSLYPPSKHIGLFDSYNGYKNGSLPSNEKSYTGKWELQYPNSSNVYHRGSYLDGLPDGVWNSYYFFGMNHITGIYENGKAKQIIYSFPDGLPYSLRMSDGHNVSFYPDGTIEEQKNAKTQGETLSGWTWNPISKIMFPIYNAQILCEGTKEIITFLYLFPDNSFSLWYFITTEQEIKKGVVKGKLDSQSGTLSLSCNKVYFGNVKADFHAFRKENSLTMEIVLNEDNTPPAKIQFQMKLFHPSCSSAPEASISQSIH